MPLEEVISGFTFTGFATTPPTIPGLTVLSIFGTAKDGKNGNRVVGSPAYSNIASGTPPPISANYITVNNGTTQTPQIGYDTNIAETTAGFTMFAVARFVGASGGAAIMGVGPTGGINLTLNPANTFVSSHPSFFINNFGWSLAAGDMYDLGAANPVTTWRMYGCSFPGGGTPQVYTLYDVTGNGTKVCSTTATRTPTAAYHFVIGCNGGGSQAGAFVKADVAACGFATGVLSMANQQIMRTWLLGVLGPRGVTGF